MARRAQAVLAQAFLLVGLLLGTGRAGWSQDAPIPPDVAPSKMSVPEGFQVTLFAGEPDIVQPIAMTLDARGRMWVVECLSYPDWERNGARGNDRVTILEDRDGDGRFDSRKVFWDQGANLTSIEVGFGGVWLCATPNLLFIPDRNADDVPDGPPQVLLDGWDLEARHNVFNGLTWGPDGWLYGCNGILSNSFIGKPGTPDDQRVELNCGVWRYHPTRRVFEPVAWGTTNPWGLDFDDFGQMFITNCVIKHLFHVVPGAHYVRMYGEDLNPYTYGLIESCADHIHWGGGRWQDSRGGKGEHDQPGGGHAHSGCTIYLGDTWPDEYRNTLFTCNIHGNRINRDILEHQGSGYVAHHGRDFLMANDTWFRGIAVKQAGPDGSVYVTDWSDTDECHDYEDIHRENGRIYKITYGRPAHTPVNLTALPDDELVQLQWHRNDWFVRQARRLLQERAVAGTLASGTHAALVKILETADDPTRRLRALWALHATNGLSDELLVQVLNDSHEYVRGWAVQLLVEDKQISDGQLNRLAALAMDDPSAVVRLFLASALQRLPIKQRWPIAAGLVAHAEDAEDAYLPLMIWYGVEPCVAADPARAIAFIPNTKIPLVREYIARRSSQLNLLIDLLTHVEQPAIQRDVLKGIHKSLEGRREVPMPSQWRAAYENLARSGSSEVRRAARLLAVVFGDEQVMNGMRKVVQNGNAPEHEREDALRALVQKGDPRLALILQELVAADSLRGPALRGLAAYGDARTPQVILRHYGSFTDAEKRDAVNTLASRRDYARVLLDAIVRGDVSRKDVSAFTARQLAGLGDPEIAKRLQNVWGNIREMDEDKAALIARYKEWLTPDVLQDADPANGRAVFAKTCATCHRFFDEGRAVGPDLTGSQRTNLDYVLQNVLDPNGLVGRDYQVTVIVTVDGRVVSGIVRSENQNAVIMQTANDEVVIPLEEIDERTQSPVSMMPEGIFEKLSDQDVRDLIRYLASPQQVPLPDTATGAR